MAKIDVLRHSANYLRADMTQDQYLDSFPSEDGTSDARIDLHEFGIEQGRVFDEGYLASDSPRRVISAPKIVFNTILRQPGIGETATRCDVFDVTQDTVLHLLEHPAFAKGREVGGGIGDIGSNDQNGNHTLIIPSDNPLAHTLREAYIPSKQ